MIKETYAIHKSELKKVKKAIAAINKKAKKIGCDPIKLTFGEEYKVKRTTEYGRKYYIYMLDATVEYEMPKIDGWELVCTFDIYPNPDSDAPDVVMTSTVPDKVVPPEYLTKNEIHCDHCNQSRYRTHSMLMMHESGDTAIVYKEVGSTCIKDFFGHDPTGLLLYAGLDFQSLCHFDEDEADTYHNGGGRGINATDLQETLAYASATMRKFGWVSKKEAYEKSITSTADDTLTQMFPHPKMRDEDKIDLQDRDNDIANGCIKYFNELDPPQTNDYLWNCKKVVELGYVPLKHIGIVVSMIPVYQRHLADLKAAEGDTSEFVGEKKERIRLIPAEVTFKKYCSGDWGTSALYIFQGDDGNTYKCFYTGSTWDFEMGDRVLVTGTVKKHETFRGRKATMLTRCIVTRDV
jgi:hypothetical protein